MKHYEAEMLGHMSKLKCWDRIKIGICGLHDHPSDPFLFCGFFSDPYSPFEIFYFLLH